jgi:hypothetical protein
MLLEPHGFRFRDITIVADYGSVEEAVATYGFIFGDKAIDYLLDHQTSRLQWTLRIYYCQA